MPNRNNEMRIAELERKAAEERRAVKERLGELHKNASQDLSKVGFDAVKKASVLGLNDPKVLTMLARKVVFPSAVAAGRMLTKKGNAKRLLGLGIIAAGAACITKGILSDTRKKNARHQDSAEQSEQKQIES